MTQQGWCSRSRVLNVVAAALLALSVVFPASSLAADTQHDVVIVGAGVAGLYAAYTLDNLGFDVLVLEAMDRRGGRVHDMTQVDPDFWIGVSEVGASYINGSGNNFLHDDIVQFDLDEGNPSRLTDTFLSYDKNGTVTFESDGWDNSDTVAYPGRVPTEIYDYWNFYYHVADGDDHAAGFSVEDDLIEHQGISPSDPEHHLYRANPGMNFQARLDDLEVRSYSRQDQQWKYTGVDKGFKTSGYLQTLDELYFDQINGKVMLSSPVTEINTAGPQPYALVGSDKHFADAILVTVSAGVINAGGISFVPALPAAKTDAYLTLNMPVGGTGASVILKWDHIFWGDKSEFMITDGAATACWNQGLRKDIPAEDKTVWKCLIAPDSYDLFLAGLSEADKISAVANDFLDTWSAGSLTDLVDGHFEDWGANPYTRGSYSSAGAGSYPDSGPNMREVAAEPIGTSLYFAGEATHPTSPAVVVSAMETGERAALEIDLAHTPAPEPQSWMLNVTAIVCLVALRRRRWSVGRGRLDELG